MSNGQSSFPGSVSSLTTTSDLFEHRLCVGFWDERCAVRVVPGAFLEHNALMGYTDDRTETESKHRTHLFVA